MTHDTRRSAIVRKNPAATGPTSPAAQRDGAAPAPAKRSPAKRAAPRPAPPGAAAKPTAARAPAAGKAKPGKPAPKRAPRTKAAKPPAEPSYVDRLLALVTASLEDDKAEDLVVIDLGSKSSFTDRMVIASGKVARQLAAMAEHLARKLKEAGFRHVRIEGERSGDWVLVDAGDVVVHLFRPEIRAHYNLEKMWGAALPDAPAEGEALRAAG